MPKISEIARINKRLAEVPDGPVEVRHKYSRTALVAYIEKTPGATSRQIGRVFFPDRPATAAHSAASAFLKTAVDRGHLSRQKEDYIWHYYPVSYAPARTPAAKPENRVQPEPPQPKASTTTLQEMEDLAMRFCWSQLGHISPEIKEFIEWARTRPGAR